jgi:hypothetical protein
MCADAAPDPGTGLTLRSDTVAERAALAFNERRTLLPTAPCQAEVRHLESTIGVVNNGVGLWAREGGRIGNSEVRALLVRRSPTPDEIEHGADPDTFVVRRGYEALSMLFENSSLDVQTEIYRRLGRRRPWWAWLDVFGWFRGARAPIERFEEEYAPGGPVEVFVMGHDQGRWFLPNLFRRWFGFTVGRGNWMLGRREVTRRGGDVEAEDIIDRGYAPSLLRQFEDMTSAQRWRALYAISPDLLDTPVGCRLEEIDPTWFDRGRFGVAFLYDADDHSRGEARRELAADVREFLSLTLDINPYLVENGFDESFVSISPKFPEIPSEQVHQFAVDLRERLIQGPGRSLDILQFGGFMRENYPRWPQLTPEQIRTVLAESDQARVVGRRVDLWGEAVAMVTRRYSTSKVLSYSTRERVGTDSEGRPKYRTKRSRWVASVPAVEITFDVRGAKGTTAPAVYDRTGNAIATGHRRHRTVEPTYLTFAGGVECFPGELDPILRLVV